MDWKVLVILLVVNIAYLIFGGAVFHFLEEEEEDDTRVVTRTATTNFLVNHSCVNPEELEQLIRAVVDAYDRGILAVDNASNPSHWDFGSSVFFSGTVVTTIGYGHISPVTQGGRAFCVFYAIFGIPLMLVLLAGIGDRLHLMAERFDKRLNLSICAEKPKLGKAIRAVVILTLGILLFLFIPGLIFSAFEGWTYAESLYYGVITLTTIGFGDFVPANGDDDDYKARGLYTFCIWCWIFIGLAWLAMVLAGLQELVNELTSKVEEKVLKREQAEEDENKLGGKAGGNNNKGNGEEKKAVVGGEDVSKVEKEPLNNQAQVNDAQEHPDVQVCRL